MSPLPPTLGPVCYECHLYVRFQPELAQGYIGRYVGRYSLFVTVIKLEKNYLSLPLSLSCVVLFLYPSFTAYL